jgi:hypothetical protein
MMKAPKLLKRLVTYLRKADTQRTLNIALVTAGAAAARRLFLEYHGRLVALEERGLVPIDDLATVGDLAKLEDRVSALDGKSAGELPDDPEGQAPASLSVVKDASTSEESGG